MLALVLCALLASEVSSTSFLRSGQVTEADARSDLKVEMGPTLSPAHGVRLSVLQEALADTFRALPKNKYGNLDHQSVRYVIHRLFVQRYGWFVLGLEPGNETKSNLVKEWVPSYLQNLLEKRFGDRGMDLVSLTSFAAALEDLVRRESVDRLRTTFTIHNAAKDRPLESEEELKEIANSYYLSFLMSFNLEAKDLKELEAIKADFLRDYPGWAESKAWYEELLRTEYKPAEGGKHTFQSASDFVSKIGEKYYEFNDKECRSLKSTLRSMEGLKAGRVRLSTFYQKALYSHWRFTEKADYLRTLGALDESDAANLQIISSNYVMSRPNCLEVSNIYAICCRNECEGLMSHIEKEVAASSAPAGQIAELVAELATETVEAPRKLSSALLRRLHQVAEMHGGKVPLHGRLFAQWMHHAFPRECPYPHELGTTSPQTPDEWMQGSGQKASSASPEEMKLSIESDSCAIGEDGKPSSCTEEQAGGSELPWSEAEELPIAAFAAAAGFPGLFEELGSAAAASRRNQKASAYMDVIAACLVAFGLAVLFIAWYVKSIRDQNASEQEQVLLSSDHKGRMVNVKTFLLLWAAAGLFWMLNLLDTGLFAISIIASLAAFLFHSCNGARQIQSLGARSKETQEL